MSEESQCCVCFGELITNNEVEVVIAVNASPTGDPEFVQPRFICINCACYIANVMKHRGLPSVLPKRSLERETREAR